MRGDKNKMVSENPIQNSLTGCEPWKAFLRESAFRTKFPYSAQTESLGRSQAKLYM